jgi:hypothetical protein
MALPLEVRELVYTLTLVGSPENLCLSGSVSDMAAYTDLLGHVVKCKLHNISRTCRSLLYETMLIYIRQTTFSLLWISPKVIEAFRTVLSQFDNDEGARSIRALGNFRINIFKPDVYRYHFLQSRTLLEVLAKLPTLHTITFTTVDRHIVSRSSRRPFTGDQLRATLGLEALISAVPKPVCRLVVVCYRLGLRGDKHYYQNLLAKLRRLIHCADRNMVVEPVYKDLVF